ncbi:E3 SUMO-protein ligase RanBP2 [Gryllus bimaculatus]|nr:E3 SUMO-protein ligase RanBP2 [Gryllus bimaculatus]
MFRTKKDVDRHVQELFRKLKGERERKSKYFNIARLYYQVGDYEAARKYVASFLSIRDDSSSAHKLLGQSLEALGQKENALEEFKCSLMLESNQSDLVLKVCELMADPEVKVDKSTAKYWSERAEQLFPHHPTVFKLKEKLVTSNEEGSAPELEKLIIAELAARPKDVSLHVRLLQLHLESGRIKEAFSTAIEVEMRCAFREELKWYECLTDVCKAYAEATKPCGWEFFFHYTAILERAACLNLQEQYGSPRRSWAQAVGALFNFDQVLEVASCQTPPSSEATMYQEFLKHQRAQLCLHYATALFKKAKKEPSSWIDVSRIVAPLLLHALVPPVDIHSGWISQTSKSRRKCVEWWAKEGAYRNSQAGHLVLSLVTDRRSHFLERVIQFCTGNWRERLYQKIFNTRDHQQAIGTSHFVGHQGFSSPPHHIPSSGELRPHDEMSQRLYPNSLHHMIWLGLRELNGCNKRGGAARLGADFRCLVYENLQYSCNNSSLAGSETLCQLDIDAFLYASILCAKATLDEEQAAGFRGNDRPQTLPANITDYLCTISQSKWWTAAHRVYTNQARGDLGEIRQTLQRGVEVIRVLGNHGLDVRLIVQLARIFSERASVMATRSHAPMEMAEVEARAAMYWTSALPLLDKLQRNQTVRTPHTRLFEYQGKDLSMAEINTLLEEGRYFLACQMMKEDKHEKAIEAFQQLKSPYASFHQAMIYKKLAALELEEQQGELITSEMRSRHIILLTKVRECLYLTLDRLRSPGVDRKHPLNAELSAHIEEIESQLARIDPDVCRGDVNRNDLDGISDGSVSSGPSVGENGNSTYGYTSLHLTPRHLNSSRFSSTPYRNNHSHRIDSDTLGHDHSRRTEARPSPERLEAQIRHLMHGRDTQMQQVMQQNKALLESHRTVADNLNKVAHSLEELKNLIQELIKKDNHKRSESQMNSDLPQVGDPDDDLYVFDEDYSEDVNIPASHLGQYQAFPQYPNYAGASYRHLPGMMGSSTVTYGPTPSSADSSSAVPPPQLLPPAPGMGNFFRNVDPSLIYPQTLSYYGQGALPFSEGQQLPDFRPAPPGAPPGAPAGPVFSLGPAAGATNVAADAQALHGTTKLNAPPAQTAPVNVVITSSDTLPTTVPQTQPTLSVTIPPQHRLGTPLVHSAVPPAVAGALAQPPPCVPPGIPAGVPPPAVPAVVAPVVPPGVPPVVPAGGIAFPGVPGGALAPALPGQIALGATLPPASVVNSAASTVPHAFQITMPPQAQVPVASRLEKGAAALSPVLPISTQTLLSSVPSPVYSAVGFEKTTKEPGTPSTTTVTTSSQSTPVGTKVHTSPPKPTKGRVSTGSVAESEDGVDEIEHDPCPDFQPVIPLPAEVEVTTGEEQEIVLYECRCKLFRFVDKEWKERGVGQLKLLHNQETGKVRLLMRREQVLKVCANHFLTPDMLLTRMKDKAWMWVANDFADEQMRLEKLCVRFKTADDADAFADAFSNACELSKTAKMTPVKGAKQQEISSTSASVTSVTPVHSSATSTAASSPAEKIVVGGFTFISPPKFTTASSSKVQAEKETAKEKDKAAAVAKPSPFAQFTFGAPTSKASSDQTTSLLIGSPLVKLPTSGSATSSAPSVSVTSTTTSGERELPPLRRPHMTSLMTSSSPALDVMQKEKPPEKDSAGGGDPLMFKATNLPTFSSLASVASDKPAFQTKNTFKGFEGAGTPLFSKTAAGDSKKSKEVVRSPNVSGGGEDEEEFVPTQEFTPVIAMPELVEVKTGEEGQEIVFQERAKLLRYDGESKQWKERGTGAMKILKDPQSGRVRLLMRREQVLKVCCNHLLTANIVFSVLQTCDRAWTWIAQDYSEGEVKAELFALRFKTLEQARAFGSKIDELKSQMIDDKVAVSCGSSYISSSTSATTTSISAASNKSKLSISEIWKCSKCLFSNSSEAKACQSCNALRSQPTKAVTPPPQVGDKMKLSEMFKPPSGSWECSGCYTRNNANTEQCVCCQGKKSSKSPPSTITRPQEGDKMKLSEMFKPPSGSWECTSCYTRNDANLEHCVCCRENRPTRSPPKQQSEPFKPKQGAWECKNCFSRNEETDRRCSSCASEKPSATPTKQNGPSGLKPLSELFKPSLDSWECGVCLIRNANSSVECAACSTPKPGCEKVAKDKNKTEEPIFGTTFGFSSSSQSTGFTFGIPKSDGQDIANKQKTETSGFTFGVNNSSPAVVFGVNVSQDSSSSQSKAPALPVFGTSGAQPVFGSWSFGANSSATTSLTFGTPSNTSTTAKTQSSVVSSATATKTENEKPFSFDAKPSAFHFGTPNANKPFNFGAKDATEKDSPSDTAPRNFVFGSPQNFEFNFSGVRPKSPVKSPKSPGVIGASGGEDDSGSEPEEDEGEHIYFQPVIPLPDKVPVHTGEEEEEVLYCHRAKLFRFMDGMWKERGIGDIKILKHKQTCKVRLVMRREQVLKLCLNHFLTAEMVFSEKDEKSWFWTAADFAEGEIHQEKLAIRFQNKDVAVAFKEAIDKAQANLGSPTKTDRHSSEVIVSEDSIVQEESSKDGGSLLEGVKNVTLKGIGTKSNLPSDSKGVVRTLFGESSQLSRSPASLDLSTSDNDVQVVYELTVTPEEKAAAERLKLPPNFYSYKNRPPCPGCCGCEPESDTEDSKFTKPATITSSRVNRSGELHGEKISQSLPFSSPAATSFSNSTMLPPTTQPSSFVFSISHASTPGVTTSGSEQPPDVNIFGSNNQERIASSGTASQTSVFGALTSTPSATTKALASFSFSPSENKDIKPVFGKSSETIFGQNSTGSSIFGNATVSTPTTSVTTATSVFGSGAQSPSLFSSSASSFKTSIFGSPQASFGQSSSQPFFGLPSTASEGKESTLSIFGSSGSLGNMPSATPVFGQNTPIPSTNVTFSPQFTVKTSNQSDKPFFFSVTATDSKSGKVDDKHEKPFSFSVTSTSADEAVKMDKTSVKEQTEEGVPFLPTDSSLTFSSLASKGEKAPFLQTEESKTKPFTWAGAGAQVFGASLPKTSSTKVKESPKKSGNAEGSSDEEEGAVEGEDNHDPHFEPIVALPDAIEVRTGEEDEEKVFCERAKLYRYEVELRQWKERGVGEMKLLKHPVRGTFRLLLRREQVHKVVLNQLVTPDLELSALSGSEMAWCWGGVNFAEDDATGEVCTDPKLEKLAVKFKNVELAKKFSACVHECVAELKIRSAVPSVLPEPVQNVGQKPHSSTQSAGEDEEEEEDYSDREKEEENETEEDDEDDVEEEEDDDEEDDEDEDHNIMFEKRATLHAQEPGKESWVHLGMGVLQILFDHDNLSARVYMVADNSGDELCNTLIATNTDLKATNDLLSLRNSVIHKDCIWMAKDHSEEPPVTRTFKACFSSEKSAQEFRKGNGTTFRDLGILIQWNVAIKIHSNYPTCYKTLKKYYASFLHPVDMGDWIQCYEEI